VQGNHFYIESVRSEIAGFSGAARRQLFYRCHLGLTPAMDASRSDNQGPEFYALGPNLISK
jgi:hypothetical protein